MTGYTILAAVILICIICCFFMLYHIDEDSDSFISWPTVLMIVGGVGIVILWNCTLYDLPDTKIYSIILTVVFTISIIVIKVINHEEAPERRQRSDKIISNI